MISSETPYKLAEIIRDTWPNLYRPAKEELPPVELQQQVLLPEGMGIPVNAK